MTVSLFLRGSTLNSRAAASLVFSSAHLTAFNLKVKSYDAFLFDITNARTCSSRPYAAAPSSDTPPAIIREPAFITVQGLWPPALKRDPASKRHGGYSRQYGNFKNIMEAAPVVYNGVVCSQLLCNPCCFLSFYLESCVVLAWFDCF